MAESTHWYTSDGEPAYTVIGSNGVERPTTLRDARKLGLLPSVTTIIRMAAAPALEKWKRDQVLMCALTLPRAAGEKEADWLRRVELDSQEQARKAAERGIAIHAAVEQHFRGEIPDHDLWPWVQKAKAALPDQPWRAEKSFASIYGYGGRTDLSSDAWVIDLKSKDGAKADVYDEHMMQVAACRNGMGLLNARGGILFMDRTQPGAVLVEISGDDLARGFAMFTALLDYHRAKTGHCP